MITIIVIILGDFNLPNINWPYSPSSNLLCDLVFKFNFTQLILNTTNSRRNMLITDIDHCISNIISLPVLGIFVISLLRSLSLPKWFNSEIYHFLNRVHTSIVQERMIFSKQVSDILPGLVGS